MRVSRVLAGTTEAVLATVGLPAVAEAAPVNLSRALLAADEFPLGTSGYTVALDTLRISGVVDAVASTECDRKVDATFRHAEGARFVSAKVRRGTTGIESMVVDRRITAAVSDMTTTCDAATDQRSRPVVLPSPADLTRLHPYVVQYGKGSVQGWADVRGTTVTVDLSDSRGTDRDLFWQTFRAQIAKVEKQP